MHFQSPHYDRRSLLLRKRGLTSKTNKLLLAAMLFPFTVSSLYWASAVAMHVVRMRVYLLRPDLRYSQHVLTYYADLCNALSLLNVRHSSLSQHVE